ncbi:MAG TPA: proline racemase family protein [Luteolibacter sp.]|nr:proline racemase family protein [Luteolibacter sp.]
MKSPTDNLPNGTVRVIDSHTGGEPTRVVISGAPDLGGVGLAERARVFRDRHAAFRRAVANEPRGHDAMVGALLLEPHDPDCACGVIFFNNVDPLHMCIHGTIGLVVTLAHMGRIAPGHHWIETPVGVIGADFHGDGKVTVANVPSWRMAADVEVEVPGHGTVRGDITWGGNWFFLIDGQGPPVERGRIDDLTAFCRAVKRALAEAAITGEGGAEIDHIEVFAAPGDPLLADSRNFVLCPGNAYDRSPCGTGTSAKLACLHAAGKLRPGQTWRQAGILDTVFEGTYDDLDNGRILPRITGSAWITGESVYHFDPADPFRFGIR